MVHYEFVALLGYYHGHNQPTKVSVRKKFGPNSNKFFFRMTTCENDAFHVEKISRHSVGTVAATRALVTMKKGINYRKLGRTSSHKWAMLRNMVTSLIEHERIVTTLPKAKEVQGLAEKLVTLSKKENKLHGRRQINRIVRTADMQTKLMNVLGPRYEYRQGGYTRVMKLSQFRQGDRADMAVIEYVDRPGEIRAARPPSHLRDMSLSDIMGQLGLDDSNDDEEEGAKSESKKAD